jgi:hypothetical protein
MKELAADRQNLGDCIGALELNDETRMDAGGLEAAASVGTPYTSPRQLGGTCVGDEALEAATSVGPSPGATRPAPFGFCIGDEALEAAATSGKPSTMPRPLGFCVGDEALEAAATAAQPARPYPPNIRGLSCIDDRALEAAGRETHPTTTRLGPCIDARAPKQAAAIA